MNSDTIRIPDTDTILHVLQAGLRVTQESLYLLKFVRSLDIDVTSARVPGCGTGLLPLGLAALFDNLPVSAVEIQKSLYETAKVNIAQNGFSDRISVVNGDFRQKSVRLPDQSCDLVVMNPPFRKFCAGKKSPDERLRISSHESIGTLEDFIRIASIELKHKGHIALVMLPERLSETLYLMDTFHVSAFRIRFLHHSPDSPANAVFIAGRKNCRMTLTIEPPCFID